MGRVADQQALQPGTIIAGRYRVARTVGKGSMGIVVEAQDLKNEARVAVKVMSPDRAHNEEARKRFVREARAASSLSNEHICRVYDVAELEDGVPFLVMEFLVGQTLEQILFGTGTPSVDVVVDWGLQALEGLAEAHRAGFVHRDIKPENLFLHEPDGASPLVKVLDFGAVKDMSSKATKLTRTGSTMGSPAYMPPEQVRAEDIDQRADVWAMAVTIYELISGKLPFGGESVPQTLAAILRENPIPLRMHRKDVPADLEALITCALTKDPSKRYANADAMLAALRIVRGKMPQTSTVTKTLFFAPTSTPRPQRNDAFADTTDMRALQLPPEDPSRVRPRVVINERGHVITVNKDETKKTSPPILPFVLAIAGGFFVAALVVGYMLWKRPAQPHGREPAPSASHRVK